MERADYKSTKVTFGSEVTVLGLEYRSDYINIATVRIHRGYP